MSHSLQRLLNPQHNERPATRSTRGPNLSPINDSDFAPSPSGSHDQVSPDHESNLHPIIPPRNHYAHPHCPDTLDCLPDTTGKPQHTLPVILRCAILGAPKERLTIREIYAAMEDKYPYYKTAGTTWKQSVRHHLSLNRLFERQQRPEADPGFGSYWTVNLLAPPGTKRPRKRGRPNKAAAAAAKIVIPPSRMVNIPHLPEHVPPEHLVEPTRRQTRARLDAGSSKPYSPLDEEDDDDRMVTSDEYDTPEDSVPSLNHRYDSPRRDTQQPEFVFHNTFATPHGYTPNTYPPPLPPSLQPSVSYGHPTSASDHGAEEPDMVTRLQHDLIRYKRKSDEKVAMLEARLSESQSEVERLRRQLMDAEDQLDVEAERRRNAESSTIEEGSRNRDAHEALDTLQAAWRESMPGYQR